MECWRLPGVQWFFEVWNHRFQFASFSPLFTKGYLSLQHLTLFNIISLECLTSNTLHFRYFQKYPESRYWGHTCALIEVDAIMSKFKMKVIRSHAITLVHRYPTLTRQLRKLIPLIIDDKKLKQITSFVRLCPFPVSTVGQ